MTQITADRRLLLVHAHPDDESINNAATMAKYVAEGAHVTLVTCTLGELGEVLVPELEHLASDRDGGLGEHRIGELEAAMAVLGVTDHRFLGGPGRYHDSGMVWSEDETEAMVPPDLPEGAFWSADLHAAADDLVPVIREVRPQVLVTYDEFGSYGHPDHVQTHRVAHYAATLAAAPVYKPELGEPWDIAKVYWTAMSASRWREGLRLVRESGDTTTFEGMDPDGPMPRFVVDDDRIACCIRSDDHVQAKMKAMQAHATQITVDGPFFSLADNLWNLVWGSEYYSLVKGQRGPTDPDTGWETDLFAGVD